MNSSQWITLALYEKRAIDVIFVLGLVESSSIAEEEREKAVTTAAPAPQGHSQQL